MFSICNRSWFIQQHRPITSATRAAAAIAFGYPRVRSCEYRRVNDLWLSATCAVVNGGRWLRSEKRSATTFVPFHPGRKSEFNGNSKRGRLVFSPALRGLLLTPHELRQAKDLLHPEADHRNLRRRGENQ